MSIRPTAANPRGQQTMEGAVREATPLLSGSGPVRAGPSAVRSISQRTSAGFRKRFPWQPARGIGNNHVCGWKARSNTEFPANVGYALFW